MQAKDLSTLKGLGWNPFKWVLFVIRKVKGAKKAVADFGANAKFFQYDPKSLA